MCEKKSGALHAAAHTHTLRSKQPPRAPDNKPEQLLAAAPAEQAAICYDDAKQPKRNPNVQAHSTRSRATTIRTTTVEKLLNREIVPRNGRTAKKSKIAMLAHAYSTGKLLQQQQRCGGCAARMGKEVFRRVVAGVATHRVIGYYHDHQKRIL